MKVSFQLSSETEFSADLLMRDDHSSFVHMAHTFTASLTHFFFYVYHLFSFHTAMCIQISNPAYAKAMAAKTSPPFVTDCTDLGGGHFAPCHPTCKEIVYPAVCLLD